MCVFSTDAARTVDVGKAEPSTSISPTKESEVAMETGKTADSAEPIESTVQNDKPDASNTDGGAGAAGDTSQSPALDTKPNTQTSPEQSTTPDSTPAVSTDSTDTGKGRSEKSTSCENERKRKSAPTVIEEEPGVEKRKKTSPTLAAEYVYVYPYITLYKC